MLVSLTAFRHTSDKPTATADDPADRRIIIVDKVADHLPTLFPAVRELPGVTATVEFKKGTRWLSSWVADGYGPATPPTGYFVPVDVAAVDPNFYREFLPEGVKHHADTLAGGGAILSQTSSELRGIPSSGGISFNNGTGVGVGGVVDDSLTRNHEILVSTEVGAQLGLAQQYLVVAVSPEADAGAIEAHIDASAPPGAGVRVRGSAGTGLEPLSALLSVAELKRELGEFSARPAAGRAIQIHQGWIDKNTVETTVPVLAEQFRCHKVVVRQVEAAMAEIQNRGLGHLVDTGDFGGCFTGRYISAGGDSNLSRHSWGAAFDLNVQGNLYGRQPTIDQRIVEIIESFGFSWGGHWDKPDGMHFEFIKRHP
ncbi:MAG: M15 family metallopeptidase [Actinomycetota bacterium]